MTALGTLSVLAGSLLVAACAPPASKPAGRGAAETGTAETAGSPAVETAAATAGADVRGEIARLDAEQRRLLIAGRKEPDTRFDNAWVAVTAETRIRERQGETDRPATFADLAVGQRVEARFDGPVAKSLPPQATAAEIVILGRRAAAAPDEEIPAEPGDALAADFAGTAGIVDKARPDALVAILRDVRTAQHAGFDRVVFEFAGSSLPGYHVEYVDQPVRQCGSGRVALIAGDGWLQVRLVPAQAHTESGQATVADRERDLDYPVLLELESTCDFEAHVEWVLGVASPNRYRVLELQNPPRLVVDVKHAPH